MKYCAIHINQSTGLVNYYTLLINNVLTLSPRKAKKPASPTVTNYHKAELPACWSLVYSRKDKILAWKFRGKKLLQIMLCLGAPGLRTPHCGSSGVRGLSACLTACQCLMNYIINVIDAVPIIVSSALESRGNSVQHR